VVGNAIVLVFWCRTQQKGMSNKKEKSKKVLAKFVILL